MYTKSSGPELKRQLHLFGTKTILKLVAIGFFAIPPCTARDRQYVIVVIDRYFSLTRADRQNDHSSRNRYTPRLLKSHIQYTSLRFSWLWSAFHWKVVCNTARYSLYEASDNNSVSFSDKRAGRIVQSYNSH